MQHDNLDVFETRLDETAKAHLLETTRWTKFLGICYIVFLILVVAYLTFVVVFLNMSTEAAAEFAGALGVTTGVIAAIGIALNVYPIYALLKFSSCMKKGIQSGNQDLINEGFRFQKAMYRYLGILTIVYLILVLLSFILGGVGTMMAA